MTVNESMDTDHVDSTRPEEVDAAHGAAVRLKDEFAIKEILPIEVDGPRRSFCRRTGLPRSSLPYHPAKF